MAIPIVYFPQISAPNPLKRDAPPVFVLAHDNWNDYSIYTQFHAYLLVNGESRYIGPVRLQVADEDRTSEVLKRGPPSPIGGYSFEGLERPFVSLGGRLGYYETLKQATTEWETILSALHDVVLLEHRRPDAPDLDLRGTKNFRTSLLRGLDETRAYGEARQLLFGNELRPDRFNFSLPAKDEGAFTRPAIDFIFLREGPLPSNVIVLIGSNGLGKTQTIYAILDILLKPATRPAAAAKPAFLSVVGVSYSPFEKLPINRPTVGAPKYSYCGFRDATGWGGVEEAWRRSMKAFTGILKHDSLPDKVRRGKPKLSSVIRVLEEGLGCNQILATLRPDKQLDRLWGQFGVAHDGRQLIDICRIQEISPEEALKILADCEPGRLSFSKNGTVIPALSAGQQTFVFMVLGVIDAIEHESLVVVDEPELGLHPNLIVSYLRMLNTLLRMFQSFAIMATHSVFVAREFPASSVRVFYRGEDGRTVVRAPTVETFAGDLAAIAGTVFQDLSVKKPFEALLRDIVGEERNFARLLETLGPQLSTHALTYIRNILPTLPPPRSSTSAKD